MKLNCRKKFIEAGVSHLEAADLVGQSFSWPSENALAAAFVADSTRRGEPADEREVYSHSRVLKALAKGE